MSIGLTLPPSKSQTMRALLFALLAKGKSVIHNPLFSPDTNAMILALKHLGASVVVKQKSIEVKSEGKIGAAEDVIHCGNSGLILRLLGAVSALSQFPMVFSGDESLRHQRPVQPLLSGLNQLGVEAFSLRGEGAPFFVRGPLQSGKAVISGEDSQPVSGLIIACSMGVGPFTLEIENPGERPWIDLTFSWLDRFHITYERDGYEKYFLPGNHQISSFEYFVPIDFSSALFPIVAAIIMQKSLTINNFVDDLHQGDKRCIELLREKGANISFENGLKVGKSEPLTLGDIDINPFIDSLPILAVLACFSKGKTRLLGAKIARKKESDRIHVMAKELSKMGANIVEDEESLTICPSPLQGSVLNSYNDHRIAMALSVASLKAKGKSTLKDVDCVSKSYPHFFQDLENFK